MTHTAIKPVPVVDVQGDGRWMSVVCLFQVIIINFIKVNTKKDRDRKIILLFTPQGFSFFMTPLSIIK